MDSPIHTMATAPAPRARSTTASRSASKTGSARWAWLSMKLGADIADGRTAAECAAVRLGLGLAGGRRRACGGLRLGPRPALARLAWGARGGPPLGPAW